MTRTLNPLTASSGGTSPWIRSHSTRVTLPPIFTWDAFTGKYELLTYKIDAFKSSSWFWTGGSRVRRARHAALVQNFRTEINESWGFKFCSFMSALEELYFLRSFHFLLRLLLRQKSHPGGGNLLPCTFHPAAQPNIHSSSRLFLVLPQSHFFPISLRLCDQNVYNRLLVSAL